MHKGPGVWDEKIRFEIGYNMGLLKKILTKCTLLCKSIESHFKMRYIKCIVLRFKGHSRLIYVTDCVPKQFFSFSKCS